MSVHQDKVGSLLAREIQTVLSRGLNDPRVRGLMSVTRVEVSSDLAHATVSITVMPAEHAELTLHGLRHAATHIQSTVARQVRLRRMPRLAFRLDDSLKREARILAAIDEAQRSPSGEVASDETHEELHEDPDP